MPDSWNAETYRNRAQMWREKADALPEGRERNACLTLAEGYAHLAALIDEAKGNKSRDEGLCC
jgi:hypothetical protein